MEVAAWQWVPPDAAAITAGDAHGTATSETASIATFTRVVLSAARTSSLWHDQTWHAVDNPHNRGSGLASVL